MARKYGLRPPYLAYTSRLEHPGKNHVRLIRAYESLRRRRDIPHQLVLAGSDWSGAEEIHRVIGASPFREDILTPGFIPTEDLPDLYSGADLFVFPSLFEGFGMPILEAMASGVPVACSDVSSLPEVAGDAAVLFDPGREASMAEAMGKLLDGGPLREEMIRKGLQRSEASSWAAATRRTLEVLEEVA
jgi:glycosyltransferase involved in cell wall biosynthesis